MGEQIYFSKMQGIGNDYIYINCLNMKENTINNIIKNVKNLSNRNFGIGADGVILICKSDETDAKMRIFNSDGSEAKMCGNGIRCVGKFLYEKGIVKKEEMEIETLSGNKKLILQINKLKRIDEHKTIDLPKGGHRMYNEIKNTEYNMCVEKITVDMGEARLFECVYDEEYVQKEIVRDNIFNLHRKEINPVEIGNYHLVIFEENIEKIDFEKYIKQLKKKEFSKNANIEIVEIIDKENIKIRVWENGTGETLSCGTGASASAFVYHVKCGGNKKINVNLKGGDLIVTVCNKNKVYLEGNAKFVFEGKIII